MDPSRLPITSRTVRYGCPLTPSTTCFDPKSGKPPEEDRLYANEIAVDVGGRCWGFNTEEPIIDHHFVREEGNYPSAAAAVLHLCGKIAEWLENLSPEARSIQIVTHCNPDFDALASVTAVEALIREPMPHLNRDRIGLSEYGWLPAGDPPSKINWFSPRGLHVVPASHRWLFYIASVASYSDACKEYAVPVHLRLPAFLEAAACRSRAVWLDEERRVFFDAVRSEIQCGANPLTDVLLASHPGFKRETELLKRVPESYAKDLKQVRISVAPIPIWPDFVERYRELSEQPLLQGGTLNRAHVDSQIGEHAEPVDGVYIRDPECILFKTMARQDAANSPSGRGFVFTAIAYSNAKQSVGNSSDYFFSLDPEAIPGANLYPVWALLQEQEVKTRIEAGCQTETAIRVGYEKRAVGYEGHFRDPWFDGSNSGGTIVVTPSGGTAIGPPGVRRDLMDDPVVAIVRQYLDQFPYSDEPKMLDFSLDPDQAEPSVLPSSALEDTPPPENAVRFVQLRLAASVELKPGLADAIQRRLWRLLNGGVSEQVPADWGNHTWSCETAVGVWSRRGIAIATIPEAESLAAEVAEAVGGMAKILRAIERAPKELTIFGDLLETIARVRSKENLSRCRLQNRFFDALDCDALIEVLHARYAALASNRSLSSIESLQKHASLLEVVIIAIYVVELAHILTDGAHAVLPRLTLAYLVGSMALMVVSFVVASKSRLNGLTHSWRRLWPQGACLSLVILAGIWLSIAAHHEIDIQKEKERAARVREAESIREELSTLNQKLEAVATRSNAAPQPNAGKKQPATSGDR